MQKGLEKGAKEVFENRILRPSVVYRYNKDKAKVESEVERKGEGKLAKCRRAKLEPGGTRSKFRLGRRSCGARLGFRRRGRGRGELVPGDC